jgi:uncharacterized membrane protein (Fun14 family)
MSLVFRFHRCLRLPVSLRVLESKTVLVMNSSSKSTSKQLSKAKNLFARYSKRVLLLSPLALLFLSNESALCAPDGDATKANSPTDPVEKLIQQVFPMVAPLGMGGLFGLATAVAMKRLGEKVAYVVGLSFIGLQALSYAGYIKIDFMKLNNDAQKIIDADADGKITANDFIAMWRKIKDVMTTQLPGAGGFSAGFAMGLYLF